MAAADVLDALISPRLYKEPVSIEDAVSFFEESKGTLFEPCIAEAVVSLKSDITMIDRDFKTFEATKLTDNLTWWQKYHPELKEFKIGVK